MTQSKACQQCKAQIEAGARFCPYCGFNNASAPAGQRPVGAQPPSGRGPVQPPVGARPPSGGSPAQGPNQPPYQGGPPTQQVAGPVGPPTGQIGGAEGPAHGQQQYPFPQNNDPGAPRGAYRPPQSGKKSPVLAIVIVAVLLLVIAGGVLVYKFLLNPVDNNKIEPAEGTSVIENVLDAVKGKPLEDLSKAKSYMPAPGLQMSYYEMYMDGDEGPLDVVTANIIPNALVSDVSMFTDGDGEVYGGVCHYFQQADGSIAYIFDDDPANSFQVLPALIQPEISWMYSDEYGDIVYTIKDLGVSCTLDFGTLDNCLRIEIDNQVFGIREEVYYAPGLGEVLRKSIPDGAQVYRLTGYQQIDAGQAQSTILKHSVNQEEINTRLANP